MFAFKIFQENFRVKKNNRISVKGLSINTCTKCQITRYLNKTAEFCYIYAPNPCFTLFTMILAFSDLPILSNFSHPKSVLGYFLRFWQEPNLKTCITPPKLKVLNLTILTWWPWMTLIWEKVAKGLGWYSEATQTRAMLFHHLYFNLQYMQYIRLAMGWCEYQSGIDFRQRQAEIFQVKIFCTRLQTES